MNWYNVLTPEIRKQLEANWNEQLPLKGTRKEQDFKPVCKLFLPWGSGVWLLTELEPGTSLAFGLCDLGFGTPELGNVCLEELYSVEGPGGLRVELDRFFKPSQTLSGYANHARMLGTVIA